ncbi:DUF4136 domain-containing protein [Shewanella sp. KX20019]|uniref:DUF4136 domain-containing protein n=1 Tax=Shewanella sp. KX20019 TaxID=2803864 RepID=UPI001925B7DC|nr:DUF4136 domain-containing protein [Shewanella sp. KX20019]QQX78899.1 DUF4136 domain-containing protein [Shewanella sp. KX20019]
MIKNYVAVILIGLMALMGCSSSEVTDHPISTTMVSTGDLSQLNRSVRVFGWHPTMFAVHASDKVDEKVVIAHMQHAITQAMQAKGYRLATTNEVPSILVGFGLALESEMSDKEILKRAGLVAGLSTQGVDEKYEKGSVLVAIFSPYNPMPIWRVLAQGFTELDKNPTAREQRFEQLLSTMLKPLPIVKPLS